MVQWKLAEDQTDSADSTHAQRNERARLPLDIRKAQLSEEELNKRYRWFTVACVVCPRSETGSTAYGACPWGHESFRSVLIRVERSAFQSPVVDTDEIAAITLKRIPTQ